MKVSEIKVCVTSPEVSTEQFIPDHFFLYLITGTLQAYDGTKAYTIQAGGYGLGRRNHLAKYSKQPYNGQFQKIAIIFDQAFLKNFSEKYHYTAKGAKTKDALLALDKNPLIESFIQSLLPYYNAAGVLDETFLNLKREELLLILLKSDPELANVFFDFGTPEKIDLEEFMQRNYRFNVGIERFAYLTGRSLSAFKRDFQKMFNDTPNHWLMQKRLEEAYFLIAKVNKKPSDIYLDLGFEDLSHFSFAFKKQFGHAPTKLSPAQRE